MQASKSDRSVIDRSVRTQEFALEFSAMTGGANLGEKEPQQRCYIATPAARNESFRPDPEEDTKFLIDGALFIGVVEPTLPTTKVAVKPKPEALADEHYLGDPDDSYVPTEVMHFHVETSGAPTLPTEAVTVQVTPGVVEDVRFQHSDMFEVGGEEGVPHPRLEEIPTRLYVKNLVEKNTKGLPNPPRVTLKPSPPRTGKSQGPKKDPVLPKWATESDHKDIPPDGDEKGVGDAATFVRAESWVVRIAKAIWDDVRRWRPWVPSETTDVKNWRGRR